MNEKDETKVEAAAGGVRLEREVRPCPFCGETDVAITEGSSFRWRYAFCTNCDARAGEVRIQTLGLGTKEEWEADAKTNAIEEWNKRA